MLLALVEVVAVFYVAINIGHVIWRAMYTYVVPRLVDNGPYIRSMGKWAVITGATTGIGKEYALKLAECGINIVLISRSEDKLKQVAAELEETYDVDTRIIVANFLDSDSIYDDIRDKLSQLDIGILVNNVGISSPGLSCFLDIPDRGKVTADTLKVNCLSVPMMTNIVLPRMRMKKKGVIINISSFAARFPCRRRSVYGASKAFVSFFTYILQKEYADDGIIFQVLTPSFVSTQMTRYVPSSFILPTAKTFVNSSFRTIGYATDTCGYWPHDVMIVILRNSIFQMALKAAALWLKFYTTSKRRIGKKCNLQ